MKEKQRKGIKTLHILSIGEILACFGLLVELSFLTEWLNFAALIALVGMIMMLVGVIKLRKVNKFFVVSFIAILTTLVVSIAFGTIDAILQANNVTNYNGTLSTVQTIVSKVISFVYIFGLVRGCALAATGKSKSKFGTHMILVNGGGKFLSITISIISGIFFTDYPVASGVLSIISTIISVIVELYFCVFLYRTYLKAKAKYQD